MILLQQSSISYCRGMANSTDLEEQFGIVYNRNMSADESKNLEDIRMHQVVGSNREPNDKQNKQVYQPKDRLDMEIE